MLLRLCCGSQFAMSEEGSESLLKVTVVRATGLKNMDWCAPQDPYCRIWVGYDSSRAVRTGVVNGGGTDPKWPAGRGTVELEWQAKDAGSGLLRIDIYDKDTSKEDDFVGTVSLNIAAVVKACGAQSNGIWRGEAKVYRKATKVKGSLLLEVSFQGRELEGLSTAGSGLFNCCGPPERMPLFEPTPYKIHRNSFPGLLHAYQENGKLMRFKTYQVALQHIEDVFGDAWNYGRDGAHPDTFTDGPQGMVVRTALSSVHSLLYEDTLPGCPADRTTSDFLGLCSDDFPRMLKIGERDGHLRVFTYALTDVLRFSETGDALSKDNLSKHAIHAGAALAVRFAGTFRICRKSSGEPILVLDNDSGTYRPKGEHGKLLKELFELNFPGLAVLTLNVLEPQPEWTKELIGPNENKGDPESVYPGTWVWRRCCGR